MARIVQAYIDGMKGKHQQSANLFAALMRVWARMAVPCLAVKEDGAIKAVRLAPTLHRELLRAGYVDGRDFHGSVDVPHPSLVDEAFRKVKKPLVEILEEILAGIEAQGLATRTELRRVRDVLERAYGQYPTETVEDRASVVAERKATYTAVRRLYGITRRSRSRCATRTSLPPLVGAPSTPWTASSVPRRRGTGFRRPYPASPPAPGAGVRGCARRGDAPGSLSGHWDGHRPLGVTPRST